MSAIGLPEQARRTRLVEASLVVGFFFGVGLFVMRKVILSSGYIAGGDWSTPATHMQFDTYAKSGLFLWTHTSNVFGVAQPFLMPSVNGLLFAASQVLDGPQIDRLFLLGLYSFAGSSVFAYARSLGLRRASALVGGTLYVATPVFFNYTAMGWGFVLLAFSLMPWILRLFTRCVKDGALLAGVWLSLLFAAGFAFASQCIVWYPVGMLVVALFITRSGTELWRAARTLALCGLVFGLLNLPWILPLVRYGDPLLASAASQTDVPLGQRLSTFNILRGWGSLFNWPFETSYPDGLLVLTVLGPLLGYAALFVWRRDRRPRALAALTLVPLLFYALPSGFYDLPFTAVIRDVSRFILFQALGSSILAAMTIDWLLVTSAGNRWGRGTPSVLACVLTATLLLGAYPVWAGELTGESRGASDIRLRALRLSRQYESVEREVSAASDTGKALYLPSGMFLSVPADSRFNGPFREFFDIYAAYAPRPGGIFDGDRRSGEYRTIAAFINGTGLVAAPSRPGEMLGATGIRWIVVRRALEGHSYKTSTLLQHLDSDDSLIKTRDSAVVLYENPNAVPAIYASTNPNFSATSARAGLPSAFPDGFTKSRQVAFFGDSAYRTSNRRLLQFIERVSGNAPTVTFRRVNPTRWDIRVENASGPFFLVLSETFDPRWHLEPARDGSTRADIAPNGERSKLDNDFVWSDASLSDRPSLSEESHFSANGYANAWFVEPKPGQTALSFRAVFAPQSLAYVGFGVASITLAGLLGAVVVVPVGREWMARRQSRVGTHRVAHR